MAVFLLLDEVDSDGRFVRKSVVNADAIVRIDPIGQNYCRLLMHFFPQQNFYVIGTLEDLQIKFNIAGMAA